MIKRHRILREVLRDYLSLKTKCLEEGQWDIHLGDLPSWCSEEWDSPITEFSINFNDLKDCLHGLSTRKREAVFYNVILDMKQKDVAKIMGITTVSVGQYVDQAMLQVSRELWPQESDAEEEKG
jgi:DNA-directed RNA polymerase specialized sigma24 family protein